MINKLMMSLYYSLLCNIVYYEKHIPIFRNWLLAGSFLLIQASCVRRVLWFDPVILKYILKVVSWWALGCYVLWNWVKQYFRFKPRPFVMKAFRFNFCVYWYKWTVYLPLVAMVTPSDRRQFIGAPLAYKGTGSDQSWAVSKMKLLEDGQISQNGFFQ